MLGPCPPLASSPWQLEHEASKSCLPVLRSGPLRCPRAAEGTTAIDSDTKTAHAASPANREFTVLITRNYLQTPVFCLRLRLLILNPTPGGKTASIDKNCREALDEKTLRDGRKLLGWGLWGGLFHLAARTT